MIIIIYVSVSRPDKVWPEQQAINIATQLSLLHNTNYQVRKQELSFDRARFTEEY
jgi:hypothetical protein